MTFEVSGVVDGKRLTRKITEESEAKARSRLADWGMKIEGFRQVQEPAAVTPWVAAPLPEKMDRQCPACGSHSEATRMRKTRIGIFACLLLLGVLPGMIYLAMHTGDVFACRKCGFIYGDAAW